MPQSTAIDYQSLYESSQLEVEQWKGQVLDLTHQLDQLKKLIFGSRSERYVPTDPGVVQPTLFEQEPAEVPGVQTQQISYEKKKVLPAAPQEHPGRMALPAHLRRETVVLEPEQEVSGCRKIGEEVTELLECTPGELYVKRLVRPKYAAKADTPEAAAACGSRVVMASLPERPLDKSMAGVSVLAQILIDKYVDHLPLGSAPSGHDPDGLGQLGVRADRTLGGGPDPAGTAVRVFACR